MSTPSPLRIFALEYDAGKDTISPHVRYISPDNVLKDLRDILNCELVTCTEIKINGKLFAIYSDDEALLKENPEPNLYIDDDLILFGSVAIAKTDEEGNLVGLTLAEIHLLGIFDSIQFSKFLNFIKEESR